MQRKAGPVPDTFLPISALKPLTRSPDLPEGPALDRLIFNRIVTLAVTGSWPLTVETGLSEPQLRRLLERYAPDYRPRLDHDSQCGGCGTADDAAIEEEDLKGFILEHRGHDGEEAEWLAAILARRSLQSNHLWQDMGFAHRGELNAMFLRHFPALKALNSQDMKWKKFFYRQLCEREGLMLCKSPHCEICDDFIDCFGEEPGDPLSTLAHLSRNGPG